MHYVVFDCEIQNAPNDKWDNHREMGIAWICVWDSWRKKMRHFDAQTALNAVRLMQEAQLIVSVNANHFDFRLLEACVNFLDEDGSAIIDSLYQKSFDWLAILEEIVGYKVSLDRLKQSTLGSRKMGMSKTCPALWKDGHIATVAEQCESDVLYTRDIFRFAQRHGYVMVDDRRIPIHVPNGVEAWQPLPRKPRHSESKATDNQIKYLKSLYAAKGMQWEPVQLSQRQASDLIERMKLS